MVHILFKIVVQYVGSEREVSQEQTEPHGVQSASKISLSPKFLIDNSLLKAYIKLA